MPPVFLRICVFGALVIRIGVDGSAVRAAIQVELVQIPVTAEAINSDPLLATAETWRLHVNADGRIFSLELYIRTAGATIYQNPPGTTANLAPPDPLFVSLIPARAFDSYFTVPSTIPSRYEPSGTNYTNLTDGPYNWTPAEVHAWVHSTSPLDGPHSYTAAQVTFLPDLPEYDHEWIARMYERLPDGQAAEYVFTSPGLTSPFEGDVNLDFKVDGADLEILTANFGQSATLPIDFGFGEAVLDFDSDGDTDDFDGAILLSNYDLTNATPEQGDVDGDGAVGANDYKYFFHYNWGHKWNPADLNQDLAVDGADLLQWQRNLGGGFTLPPTFIPEAAAVPEPSSFFLVILCIVGVVRLRSRSSCSGLEGDLIAIRRPLAAHSRLQFDG
jgi:hypothetical protein